VLFGTDLFVLNGLDRCVVVVLVDFAINGFDCIVVLCASDMLVCHGWVDVL
jgi:hypothetical protein